jgi:hypothetical protein
LHRLAHVASEKVTNPCEELREQRPIQPEHATEFDEVFLGRASAQILASDVTWQNMCEKENDHAHKEHRNDGETKALKDEPFHVSQKCS